MYVFCCFNSDLQNKSKNGLNRKFTVEIGVWVRVWLKPYELNKVSKILIE